MGLRNLSGSAFGPGSFASTFKPCLEWPKYVRYINNRHRDRLAFIWKSFVSTTGHDMSYSGFTQQRRAIFDYFDATWGKFNASEGRNTLFSTDNDGGCISCDHYVLVNVF